MLRSTAGITLVVVLSHPLRFTRMMQRVTSNFRFSATSLQTLNGEVCLTLISEGSGTIVRSIGISLLARDDGSEDDSDDVLSALGFTNGPI
jgi:hypothetical protein